jgi:DNA-binding IclR family transcriptional regulator
VVGNGATNPGRLAPESSDRETSIRRGLQVLLTLGTEPAIANGGLGVTRISEMLGREKSQVSRTLKILAEYGMVDRDPDTLAYRLGWRIYALANLAGERRLLDAAPAVLRGLVARLAEGAHLSVLEGAETLTMMSESPPQALQAVSWVGRTVPAYCTSNGHALLLDHSREELEALFADTTFEPRGPNTVSGVAALHERIVAARARGFATADEEMEPGLVAAAAPVRDMHGRIVAAVNVSGPKFRLGERIDEAGSEVVAAAEALSSTLRGDRAPATPSNADRP